MVKWRCSYLVKIIGENYYQYTDSFKKDGINGLVLVDLTKQELEEELGITKGIHVRRVSYII